MTIVWLGTAHEDVITILNNDWLGLVSCHQIYGTTKFVEVNFHECTYQGDDFICKHSFSSITQRDLERNFRCRIRLVSQNFLS